MRKASQAAEGTVILVWQSLHTQTFWWARLYTDSIDSAANRADFNHLARFRRFRVGRYRHTATDTANGLPDTVVVSHFSVVLGSLNVPSAGRNRSNLSGSRCRRTPFERAGRRRVPSCRRRWGRGLRMDAGSPRGGVGTAISAQCATCFPLYQAQAWPNLFREKGLLVGIIARSAKVGAEERTRTSTRLPGLAPEASASANSATPAQEGFLPTAARR